ncbi:hypothetical protein D3C85_872150 [compost metagenome]
MLLVVPGVQVGIRFGQHIGFDDVVPRRVLPGRRPGQIQRPVQHPGMGAGKQLGQAGLDLRQRLLPRHIDIGVVGVQRRERAELRSRQAVGQTGGQIPRARLVEALAQRHQQYRFLHSHLLSMPDPQGHQKARHHVVRTHRRGQLHQLRIIVALA